MAVARRLKRALRPRLIQVAKTFSGISVQEVHVLFQMRQIPRG